MATSFETIIDRFIGKITDDLYLELTPEDTVRDAKLFLLDAIPKFEFPRFALYNYNLELETYNVELTDEEIDIFAILMKIAWIDRQIASIEVTRMKYSGSDFKMTSQANHLSKLITAKNEMQRENIHAQRLYKRRKFGSDGRVMSNWSILNVSALDTNTSVPTAQGNTSGSDDSGMVTPVPSEGTEYVWEPINE